MKKLFTILIVAIIATSMMVFSAGKPEPASPFPGDVVGGVTQGKGSPDQLLSGGSNLLSGGNRLVATQNSDGGWGWDLTGPSALNTVGPIAMGLAHAYNYSGSASQYLALQKAGAFLLAKLNTFSPSDGYLAAKLDEVFGGNTYKNHVKTNFYDKLANGTYNKLSIYAPIWTYNMTTAQYVLLVRNGRSGVSANLAAWDIGIGLVGAASCGASTTEWISGVEAEINELDGGISQADASNHYYDVIGLAGAVYGLAVAGVNFDPTSGEHAAASSTADLANILASYQITGGTGAGGFSWNKNWVLINDFDEQIQETAYAILALNQVNRSLYLSRIANASNYIQSVQLVTGGWRNYEYTLEPTNVENNEITAEALWAIAVADKFEVWVSDGLGNDANEGTFSNPFKTIQHGIDVVPAGGIVNVLPGTYDQAGSTRTNFEGTTQGLYALFINKNGITVRGVNASGIPIANYVDVVARVTTNSTLGFGPDGWWVEANNVTVSGLDLSDNASGNNKTIEVVGDNFQLKYSVISVHDGGSVYLNDWRYNTTSNTSFLKSYSIEGNYFTKGASLDITGGAGYSGSVSNRKIINNTFDTLGIDYHPVYWSFISFSGHNGGVPWMLYDVGGALITGNNFSKGHTFIRVRGNDDNSQFDWLSYWNGNTFDKGVITLSNEGTFTTRNYSYSSGYGTWSNVIRIGSIIQNEIDLVAQAGDIILAKDGTYNEAEVLLNKANVTLKAENPPMNTAIIAGRVLMSADGTSLINFKIQPPAFDNSLKNQAILVTGSDINIENNIITDVTRNSVNPFSIVGIHLWANDSKSIGNIKLFNNTIQNIANTQNGASGVTIGGNVHNVKVSNNVFTNINSTGWAYGIEISPSGGVTATPSYIDVLYCKFSSLYGAAIVNDLMGSLSADASTIRVNFNMLGNVPIGIKNLNSNVLNGKYNWWGDCSGPSKATPTDPRCSDPNANGSGSVATCYVDFTPWTGSLASDMALWLNGSTVVGINGTSVPTWQDYANCPGLVATAPDGPKEPKLAIPGVETEPGVQFTRSSLYGTSDIMTINYNSKITTDHPQSTPDDTPKTLFVVFKANEGGASQYYSMDGKQCIYEAGGPLSGYNLYIQNGYLIFGMWNRYERKYVQYTPAVDLTPASGLYPLDPSKYYVAKLAFSGTNFTATLYANGLSPVVSTPVTFSGLTVDGSDATGIGGASRTSYHNYNTGETYSDNFNGVIGDVMLFNKTLVTPEIDLVNGYLNARYGFAIFPSMKQNAQDWIVFDQSNFSGKNELTAAIPNPFDAKTSFTFNLVDAGNVSVELFDAQGQKVKTMFAGQLGAGVHEFTIEGQDLNSGLYMFRVTGDNFSESGKVILNK